jgi:hypothetical protein
VSHNQYPRDAAGDSTTSRAVPEVHAGVSATTQKRPALPPVKTDQQTPATDKVIRSSMARLPGDTKAKAKPQRHGRPALSINKERAKATGKGMGRPTCNASESQILAEAGVDICDILLGDGIHKIESLEDRMRLAIKKAESIRKMVDHGDYDQLLTELPAATLPKITPTALLKWLDREFKDVIDAVFFVDSAEEFAKLLQTFAQGIASSFFGDKVRVSVKVSGARRKKKVAMSSEDLAKVGDSATLATGAAYVSAPDRPVL